ncbi:MAG: hypothetical protein IT445_11965 [Phycisphaeraceae bacterium]|nr:hypothetical protein [Phycisphaeraceae bacterium]
MNSYLVKPIDFEQFRQLTKGLSLYWGVWNQPPNGQANPSVPRSLL